MGEIFYLLEKINYLGVRSEESGFRCYGFYDFSGEWDKS